MTLHPTDPDILHEQQKEAICACEDDVIVRLKVNRNMKKITTLFLKDPNDLGRVINKIDPENTWVFDYGVIATRKFDGTACAIINEKLYKRYDAKKGKLPPAGAIPCQDPDTITGHWPHWVVCDRNNPADKHHFQAYDFHKDEEPWGYLGDGTYELIGPKIQGNPEGVMYHMLVKHGSIKIEGLSINYGSIRKYLEENNIEGIVFHHPDGLMCKTRKSDFGFKREVGV